MKRLMVLTSILTALILFVTSGMVSASGRYLVRIFPDDYKAALFELNAVQHLDIAGVNREEQHIDVVVNDWELDELSDAFRLDILVTPEEMTAQRVDPQYKDPGEVEDILHQYASNYSNITHLVSIGQSEQGRDIWAIKISDNAAVDEDEPVILFNGQHHAREVMSTEVPLDMIEYLCTGYPWDFDVLHWVNTFEIWIVPQVNVDGTNYVFNNYDMWRKDRHVNSKSQLPRRRSQPELSGILGIL